MVIENVEHTFVTHDIQIDEHSEKEVKNKIEGAKEQGDERIITEITKRIREQIDPIVNYLRLQVQYMVN
jgi:hypothetical protein